MNTVDQLLENLGLSRNEARIYKVLLTLGTARVTEIAKQADLNKSTAQFTCQQLQRRGFISMIRRKNAYLFAVDDTRRLLNVIDADRVALDQKREQILRALPALDSLRNEQTALPRVHFFEEPKGVAAAWQSFMEKIPSGAVVSSFAHPLDQHSSGMPVLDQFIQTRIRRQITSRVILCDTPAAHALKKKNHDMLRETRIMTGRCCHMFSSEVMFYGDVVCLVTLQDGQECATTIENPPLARLLQTVFDGYWQSLA